MGKYIKTTHENKTVKLQKKTYQENQKKKKRGNELNRFLFK